jgi:iron complex transport system substrate-binding protein
VRVWLAVVALVGCATPTPAGVESPAGAEPPAGTALTISGAAHSEVGWTEAEVRAMDEIQVAYENREGETETHTGIPIAALLALAGVPDEADTTIFVGDDGYTAKVYLDDIQACPNCIVAFRDQGGFSIFMPGYPGNVQVRGLVEIELLAESQPAADVFPTPSEPEDVDGPVTVTDAAGRTVTLPKLPRRLMIVGRGPYMALHLLYMFPEGRERLVAVESKGATASDFLPLVDPDFLQVPTLASNPGPEQIAASAPDLVIMKSVAVEQMSESLAQVGIPVVYLGLETPEQFFQDVANLGLLLGNEARASEIAAFYQQRLDRIAQRIGDLSEEEKPRVLLIEYSDRGGEVAVQVPAPPWMQTLQVQSAGGNPVWVADTQMTDGWTVTNFEQIAVWDPDKILLVVWYTMDLEQVVAGLKADPQWSKLKAVRDDELYVFPADLYGWDNPEPRWILGVTWLATRLYPDRFADVDLHDEMVQFFGELYGMDRAAVDAKIVPQVHLDVR